MGKKTARGAVHHVLVGVCMYAYYSGRGGDATLSNSTTGTGQCRLPLSWLRDREVDGHMTSPAVKAPGLEASNDPLDTLLARLLASTSEGSDDDSKGVAGVPKPSARGPMRAGSRVEGHDPWKALSDQVDYSSH